MSDQILIVDDEKEIADLLDLYLANEGYTIHKCYDGESALKIVETQALDLAILDVMLPDVDGSPFAGRFASTIIIRLLC